MTWNSHPFVPERTLSPPCVPAHLRPLIKLAGNLIRNYSLKRKFCCPEQIIKCSEGARATFIRAQKEGGGRSEDLRRGCRLIYIYSFSPELGKRLVSWDTEEKAKILTDSQSERSHTNPEIGSKKCEVNSIVNIFQCISYIFAFALRNNCTWPTFPIITLEDNSAHIAFSTICLTAAHHRMI